MKMNNNSKGPLEIYLGSTLNIRVLTFFIENPFNWYSVGHISEYLDKPEKRVAKWVNHFVKHDMVLEKDGRFKANMKNTLFKTFADTTMACGDYILDQESE